MNANRTVKRSGGGPSRATGLLVVAALVVAELAIIGVLIVLPMLTSGAIQTWQIVLCAILLTAASAAFVVLSFVKTDGKWLWRWANQ